MAGNSGVGKDDDADDDVLPFPLWAAANCDDGTKRGERREK